MINETIDVEALRRLLKLIGDDAEDLRDLVDEFLETAPELSALISIAADTGDRNALRIAAHTLKSNARDFGAMRLSQLCATLENACRSEGAFDTKAAAAEIAREEAVARDALGAIPLDALA
jgi:HPt (histidine-containing phosphotransfer) domain-containing protein